MAEVVRLDVHRNAHRHGALAANNRVGHWPSRCIDYGTGDLRTARLEHKIYIRTRYFIRDFDGPTLPSRSSNEPGPSCGDKVRAGWEADESRSCRLNWHLRKCLLSMLPGH